MKEIIKQIEDNYLAKTYHYVQEIFSGQHLPSHDHTHHFRVWQYAKEYLTELKSFQNPLSYQEVLSVFFSCFFHDTGLSVTLEKSHGKASRKLFDTFITEQKIPGLVYYKETCNAIEKHDNKEAIAMDAAGFSQDHTLAILSVCDDLDAFGAIGILRYTEIYLLRKIPMNEIPEKITKNLKFRIKNFQKSSKHLPEFLSRHQSRAIFTMEFFNHAARCNSKEYEFLKIFQKLVIENKMDYRQFAEQLTAENQFDSIFKLLKSEMLPNHLL
jgi:hypothetical protein